MAVDQARAQAHTQSHHHTHSHSHSHSLTHSRPHDHGLSRTSSTSSHSQGHSKISRLVGRLRSSSSNEVPSTSSDCPSAAAAAAAASSSNSAPKHSRQRSRGHISVLRPTPFRSAKTHIGHGSNSSKATSNDTQLSQELWSTAYDYLRENPGTAGLVQAFEAIVAQELPEGLKTGGMNTTLRDHPDSQRFELLGAITAAGIAKRRPVNPNSQIDEVARLVIDTVKDTVDLVHSTYPAAAIAFCGFCTMTPLLLDPMLRQTQMRTGILHVTGRISWYMFLSQMLLADSWSNPAQDFCSNQQQLRDSIARLYRKVLEFEMNCVCAAASVWNKPAKNVVDWQGIGGLVTAITDAEAKVGESIDRFATEAVTKWLSKCDRDLEIAGGRTTPRN